MLRTSPGDSGSSLSAESFQPMTSDSALEGQNPIEDDRDMATVSREAFVDRNRPSLQPEDVLSTIVTGLDSEASTRTVSVHPPMEGCLVPPQSFRQTVWPKPLHQEIALDELYALRQAATLKTSQQTRKRSWSMSSLASLNDVSAPESIDQFSFAAPLSPMRERDLKALSAFFRRDDMLAVEADINQRLLSLLPEPCWEDQVFDFLKEFL